MIISSEQVFWIKDMERPLLHQRDYEPIVLHRSEGLEFQLSEQVIKMESNLLFKQLENRGLTIRLHLPNKSSGCKVWKDPQYSSVLTSSDTVGDILTPPGQVEHLFYSCEPGQRVTGSKVIWKLNFGRFSSRALY